MRARIAALLPLPRCLQPSQQFHRRRISILLAHHTAHELMSYLAPLYPCKLTMGLETSWLGGGGSSAAERGEASAHASTGRSGGLATHPQPSRHATALEAASASRHPGRRRLVGLHGAKHDSAGLGPVQSTAQHVHRLRLTAGAPK